MMQVGFQSLVTVRLSVVISALSIAGSASAAAGDVPPTTPQGITLIEVMRELPISQPEILWLRPGDSQGRTLFTYERDEPGISRCEGECAIEFPPLVAPPGVNAAGDWSLLSRKDGTKQWVYQSQPLYTWSAEQVPGEVATNVGLTETANSKFAEDAVEAGELLPPEGWKVARFTPGESITTPVGIEVSLIDSVQAVALTDEDGRTLYAFDGNVNEACAADECGRLWRPLFAPAIATGIGDFTVVTRGDGTPQWAYRGRPLFTHGDDELPGDAHGAGLHEKLQVAILTENFSPAEVGVTFLNGYGAALTRDGMTLYGGYAFEKRWGGRNLRDTFTNVYFKGKQLGGAACVDEQCLSTWRPFRAPEEAQPNGFWEPIERDDGTRQWAYKGYALYTYAGDDAPGEHYGQAVYDFAKPAGEGFSFQRVSYLQEISKASGGVGIYWNIAKP